MDDESFIHYFKVIKPKESGIFNFFTFLYLESYLWEHWLSKTPYSEKGVTINELLFQLYDAIICHMEFEINRYNDEAGQNVVSYIVFFPSLFKFNFPPPQLFTHNYMT